MILEFSDHCGTIFCGVALLKFGGGRTFFRDEVGSEKYFGDARKIA
jgi:hypothetical protein